MILGLLRHLDPAEFRLGLAAPASLLSAMADDLATVDVHAVADAAPSSWLQLHEIRRLAHTIRRFRPDIVNPHLFRSTLVAGPLAKVLRVPCVVETYHGREGWRRGLKASFVLDRLVTRCVDRVIAVSQSSQEFLIKGKRIPASKVVTVANGRDFSGFEPGRFRDATRGRLGLRPEHAVIGVLGRLETQKGHGCALQAMADIVKERPLARLLVVGDGRLRQDLEEQTRRAGLQSHVMFLGYRKDVPSLLDAMDVVIMPSRYEGMPLTAIEAAAMSKPVVATDVDGVGEVVRDGLNGRLVRADDPVALRRGVLGLLDDPQLARAMGAEGRRDALRWFSVERHIEASSHTYRQVLSQVERRRAAPRAIPA